ncbi:MAG: hypothetical protein ABIS86_02810 [Streptosporangiaceae bacterium]
MRELSETIQQRLTEAYESLHTARSEGDVYLADVRQAEIEELRRIAANHDLPHATSALADDA